MGSVDRFENAVVVFDLTLDVSEYKDKDVIIAPFTTAGNMQSVSFAGVIRLILSEA